MILCSASDESRSLLRPENSLISRFTSLFGRSTVAGHQFALFFRVEPRTRYRHFRQVYAAGKFFLQFPSAAKSSSLNRIAAAFMFSSR